MRESQDGAVAGLRFYRCGDTPVTQNTTDLPPVNTLYMLCTKIAIGTKNIPTYIDVVKSEVTLDISRSPVDFQWGSWKYPG